MKVITAPEEYKVKPDDITIFLAGGITGCDNWQEAVISHLETEIDLKYRDHLVIFNPRRDNFDVSDPSLSEEQIVWENKYLEKSEYFSMYFAPEQLQPICMFELGKAICRYPKDCLIISAHDKYPRTSDIYLQLGCFFGENIISLVEGPEEHAGWIEEILHTRWLNEKSSRFSLHGSRFARYRSYAHATCKEDCDGDY